MIPPEHHRNSAARQAQVFGFDDEPNVGPIRRALRVVIFTLAVVGFLSAAALPFFM